MRFNGLRSLERSIRIHRSAAAHGSGPHRPNNEKAPFGAFSSVLRLGPAGPRPAGSEPLRPAQSDVARADVVAVEVEAARAEIARVADVDLAALVGHVVGVQAQRPALA